MFEIKWIFYGLSRMLQFSEFVWALSYSVWDVFNNFLLIDGTDRSKTISDQKRFFIALSLYPLSFFANTPINRIKNKSLTRVISCFFFELGWDIYFNGGICDHKRNPKWSRMRSKKDFHKLPSVGNIRSWKVAKWDPNNKICLLEILILNLEIQQLNFSK